MLKDGSQNLCFTKETIRTTVRYSTWWGKMITKITWKLLLLRTKLIFRAFHVLDVLDLKGQNMFVFPRSLDKIRFNRADHWTHSIRVCLFQVKQDLISF